MPKVVSDTNILVSGLITSGHCSQILEQVKQYELYLSSYIVDEVRRVLHYAHIQKKYHLTEEDIRRHVERLLEIGETIEVPTALTVIQEDEKDNPILACAVDAQADYLVSGDQHLKDLGVYKGITVVPPAEFLKVLE